MSPWNGMGRVGELLEQILTREKKILLLKLQNFVFSLENLWTVAD